MWEISSTNWGEHFVCEYVTLFVVDVWTGIRTVRCKHFAILACCRRHECHASCSFGFWLCRRKFTARLPFGDPSSTICSTAKFETCPKLTWARHLHIGVFFQSWLNIISNHSSYWCKVLRILIHMELCRVSNRTPTESCGVSLQIIVCTFGREIK